MNNKIKYLLVALVLCSGFVISAAAEACPMCQVANEDDTGDATLARPRAYMYSILFMLAVPATMFTVFGVSFYRLSKSQALLNEEMFAATQADVSNPAENGFPGTGNDS
ncbi:hypothetical protein OAF42_03935 [Planctomicrobium sp.]|jgi:hypothetical protein|nr:hypothetical protein [Planctomicrobium sp.]MDB4733574.1 hypothetical protein [Planctomicrobium sp.]